MDLNYEQDITIDETALDVEWLDQPRKVFRYGKHLAHVNKELELSKESLNVVKAELDKAIRQNPAAYGIDKLTETQVSNAILLQDEYQAANKEMIDLRYEYEMAKVAFQAIAGRRDSLQNLTSLHGQQYFAGPRVPRDLSKEWNKKTEEANVAVAGKLRRKKT